MPVPDNFALYLLLVLALGIGFLLGRRERLRRRSGVSGASRTSLGEEYFRGLKALLEEKHDVAIDSFVESIAVNNDTVETHLALGSLVRRRGEVDRAIRVHQNLLARPVLTAAQRSQTELELARDYMAAGLLGRAENLLLELAGRGSTEKLTAQQLLLDIYQRESEWEKAVAVGRELQRHDRGVRQTLAHLECELAERALASGDLRKARKHLARGADFGDCPRVHLVGARVAFEARQYREARRHLRKARAQDADFTQETVALHRAACRELGDEAAHVEYLRECLRTAPYLDVVEELAAHMALTEGPDRASEFVMEQLLRSPTLGGFVTLLEHLEQQGEPLAPDRLALVRRFSQSLLQRQPLHRCRNCGFSTRTLMWQCPSCRSWGRIKPIVREDRR
jgi:lipopolysaccharide biosynthesis regulator YciM